MPPLGQTGEQPFELRDIRHCFPEDVVVGIMLAVIDKKRRFDQFEAVNHMGPNQSYGLVFLAARPHDPPDGTFDLAIAHDNKEQEQDYLIRWVAVPADDCKD